MARSALRLRALDRGASSGAGGRAYLADAGTFPRLHPFALTQNGAVVRMHIQLTQTMATMVASLLLAQQTGPPENTP